MTEVGGGDRGERANGASASDRPFGRMTTAVCVCTNALYRVGWCGERIGENNHLLFSFWDVWFEDAAHAILPMRRQYPKTPLLELFFSSFVFGGCCDAARGGSEIFFSSSSLFLSTWHGGRRHGPRLSSRGDGRQRKFPLMSKGSFMKSYYGMLYSLLPYPHFSMQTL